MLHLDGRLLVVQQAGHCEPESLGQDGLVLVLDVREVVEDPAGPGPQVAVQGLELGEDDLHLEHVHLLLVDRLLKQDVGHGPDHVKGAVLLAGVGARRLDDGQKKVHCFLQHLLPLLAGGVLERLGRRHRGDEVLEDIELDPEQEIQSTKLKKYSLQN